MQILQWFLNTAAHVQEPRKLVSTSTPITKNKCDHHREEVKLNDGSRRERRRHVKRVEKSKLNCDDLLLFRFLQRKDVSRPFFYHTLNLKTLASFQGRRRQRKTSKRSSEAVPLPPLGVGGNKVLPIVDSDSNSKDESKKKNKGVSRMKKLLMGWGAPAKVMNSKDGAVSKASVDDEDDVAVCDESPKISVRLGMEDYYTAVSTISKVYKLKDDQILCANTSSRRRSSDHDDLHDGIGIGCWITTDSEFVVLEL